MLPLVAVALFVAGCSDSGSATGSDARPPAAEEQPPSEEREPLRSRPQVVQALAPGDEGAAPPDELDVPEPNVLPVDRKPARVAATDAELKQELADLGRASPNFSSRAVLNADGTASPPIDAPQAVHDIIHAGNMISRTPYKWGGGHGRWRDDGYDCSGSVSFTLFAGGMLNSPLTSGGFMNWGRKGPGRWVTLYTNPGHIYMVVAGLRFDTSGRARTGSRWQADMRSPNGYVVRHPPGL